jgi:hypothetical protein
MSYKRKIHKDDGYGWLMCGRNMMFMALGVKYDSNKRWRNVTCGNCLRLQPTPKSKV